MFWRKSREARTVAGDVPSRTNTWSVAGDQRVKKVLAKLVNS